MSEALRGVMIMALPVDQMQAEVARLCGPYYEPAPGASASGEFRLLPFNDLHPRLRSGYAIPSLGMDKHGLMIYN